MVPDFFFSQLALIALVWLYLMLHWVWPSDPAACSTTAAFSSPRPKPKREPTPFAGLTTKPPCDACTRPRRPPARPLSSAPAPGAHAGATTAGGHFYPFLPEPGLCLSGLGRLGQSPRQWPSQWRSLAAAAVCRLSPLFSRDPRHDLHGKQASVELIVRVIACLAEGLGIRGTARVFEVDPEHGAAVVGRGGGAAAGLLAALPAWHTGPTSAAR